MEQGASRSRRSPRRTPMNYPMATTSSGPVSTPIDLTLNATNWRAEQALRPAVVNRKVSGGNRSTRGAAAPEILSSVIQTARLRNLHPRDVIVDLLRAPQPTVSPALATVP